MCAWRMGWHFKSPMLPADRSVFIFLGSSVIQRSVVNCHWPTWHLGSTLCILVGVSKLKARIYKKVCQPAVMAATSFDQKYSDFTMEPFRNLYLMLGWVDIFNMMLLNNQSMNMYERYFRNPPINISFWALLFQALWQVYASSSAGLCQCLQVWLRFGWGSRPSIPWTRQVFPGVWCPGLSSYILKVWGDFKFPMLNQNWRIDLTMSDESLKDSLVQVAFPLFWIIES